MQGANSLYRAWAKSTGPYENWTGFGKNCRQECYPLYYPHPLSIKNIVFFQHINQLTLSCYDQLRPLRAISRSLSRDSAVLLIHAFVTSRLDHCSLILVVLLHELIGSLDRVLRSAARLIGAFPNRLLFLYYMGYVLYLLPVPQCISYRVPAVVWHYCFISESGAGIFGCASAYLHDLWRPVSDTAGRRVFRSSAGGELSPSDSLLN